MDKGSGKVPPGRSLVPSLMTLIKRGPIHELAEHLEHMAASPQPADPPHIVFEKKLPELREARYDNLQAFACGDLGMRPCIKVCRESATLSRTKD